MPKLQGVGHDQAFAQLRRGLRVPPTSIVVALCIGAGVATLLLTAVARAYALRRRLLDTPGERRSHRVVTPRGGGIAIVAVVLPVMVWLGLADGASPVLLLGACGLGLVAGIGWIDDHRPLSPWGRLVVHALSAGLLAAGLALTGAPLWSTAIVFLLALGLINAWNFMDGIDGIAATQAIAVAATLMLLGVGVEAVLLASVLAAACAGFLPWNFPKARIFLGDVGSGALGYLLACVFALGASSRPVELLVMLLPFSAILIDASLTLLSRIITGQRFWMPHTQHLYQRCVQAGWSHAKVMSGYLIWSMLSLVLALAMWDAPQPVIIGAFATWYLLGAGIWFALHARLRLRAPVVGTRLHD